MVRQGGANNSAEAQIYSLLPTPNGERRECKKVLKKIQCEAKVCSKAKTICTWERRGSNWHSEENMELELQ